MIKTLLYLLLLIPLCSSAQQYVLFDTSTINFKSKLIGYYKSNAFSDKLDFIIDNPDDIKSLIVSFTAGAEQDPQMARDYYIVTLLQNNFDVKSWVFDMARGCTLYEGRSYAFDVESLKRLAKKNPLRIKEVTKTFDSDAEAEQYLKKQQLDRNLLYAKLNKVRHEGQFELRIPRNSIDQRVRVALDTVRHKFSRLAPPGTYSVAFIQNRNIPIDKNYYTFMVFGKRDMYDRLEVPKWMKGKWEPIQSTLLLYYRKY